jgi:hypothetical protein
MRQMRVFAMLRIADCSVFIGAPEVLECRIDRLLLRLARESEREGFVRAVVLLAASTPANESSEARQFISEI